MTEESDNGHLLIGDPQEIVGALTTLWENPEVSTLLDEKAQPLCLRGESDLGTAADQGFDNPYWDIARLLVDDSRDSMWDSRRYVSSYLRLRPRGPIEGIPRSADRYHLVYNYAWAVPSPGDITFLTRSLAGRPVIEMGAGTGYWAWQLSQAGVDVMAFDSFEWRDGHRMPALQYHPVHRGSVEQIPSYPNRVLMLCWPTYDQPFAADALDAYKGNSLIYVGEGSGGCTGDERFGDTLDRFWEETGRSPHHINFTGIRSEVGFYRRRTAPLPATEKDVSW